VLASEEECKDEIEEEIPEFEAGKMCTVKDIVDFINRKITGE
jgi:hypothetical protein